MANNFYEDNNTIQTTGTARSEPVKQEFAKLEAAFDLIQAALDRRVLIPADATNEIADDASQRALKAIGFNANGDIDLLTALGTWRGNWATGTAYASQDVVRDPASPHSLYIAKTGHTAGANFDAAEKSSKWTVIIDLTELARAEEVKFSYQVVSSNTNMVTGGDYAVDATSALALTLPATPNDNDHVRIIHVAGDIANLTVARNGEEIMGLAEDLTFSSSGDNDSTNAAFGLVYINSTYGWRIFPV